MFDSVHDAHPDGVVGFVDSDIVVEDFDQFIHLLNRNSGIFSNLKPYDVYQPFVSSGHTNLDWFTVLSRKDVSKTGQISGHTQISNQTYGGRESLNESFESRVFIEN